MLAIDLSVPRLGVRLWVLGIRSWALAVRDLRGNNTSEYMWV